MKCNIRLNPLEIGEGFERKFFEGQTFKSNGLNPLEIGEGFEQ